MVQEMSWALWLLDEVYNMVGEMRWVIWWGMNYAVCVGQDVLGSVVIGMRWGDEVCSVCLVS